MYGIKVTKRLVQDTLDTLDLIELTIEVSGCSSFAFYPIDIVFS